MEETNVTPIGEGKWTYTKEDFLSTSKPYDELYSLKDNPFVHKQTESNMADYAKSVGVTNFKALYREYQNELRGISVGFGFSNTTDFKGQEMELETGSWEANEYGIAKGESVACRHPIMPVERLVNIDTGVEKLKIAFRRGERWRHLIVEKSVLASKQKILSLADQGVSVNSETSSALVQYLSEVEDLNYTKLTERKSIGRLGYIKGEGFSPYVDGLIFDGDANFRDLFRAVSQKGSEEEWISIAKECRAMSTTARIMLAASFASPLLEVLNALPFFVHLWGGTEVGKSVALMLAASVWGNPEIGVYIKTFNSTVVGSEKTAAFLNHLPLCLDELQLTKTTKGQSNFDVYKLAQGVGRTRGNRSGGVDKTPTWRNCILTTGEDPINSTFSGGGAMNRVIDIECKTGENVITDGPRISGLLKGNYGWAGKRFVEAVYGDENAIPSIQKSYKDFFRSLSKKDTTEKQSLAASAILTADRLATGMFFNDGLQLTEDEIAEFLANKADVSAGERGFQFLTEWVAQNSMRFLSKDREGDRITDIYGIIDVDRVYVISSVFNKVINDNGFSPAALKSWMKEKGYLHTGKKGLTVTKRIFDSVVQCVCYFQQDFDTDCDEEAGLLPEI